MAELKCKICGGTLAIEEGSTVATCEYCGTKQTLPKLTDERRMQMYDRANHFRRNSDYDKAMSAFEQILNEDKTDAEAYWSIVLCRYGVEYVEDPTTHQRKPTVNRTQFTSIFADEDYKSAIEYADSLQREIYEADAKVIDNIQKGILAISQKEKPFDVFICYKETDNAGRRTPDSVLANDLYHQLTQEGLKVFFSRITLEDKIGEAYEPYIFAALNSAKVMVVLGTKPEYFKAVWVRNEWSRFLSQIKAGAKKNLVPAYKDMDPYDLPDEFSNLQAQDMSKLGFMQDLIRGIKKLTEKEEPKPVVINETKVVTNVVNNGAEQLLKRAKLALEDGEFTKADDFCEQALNIDAENAEAYLIKLLVEFNVTSLEKLGDLKEPFDNSKNYNKVVRFAGEKIKNDLQNQLDRIHNRIKEEEERKRIEAEKAEKERLLELERIKKESEEEAERKRIEAEKERIESQKEELLNKAAAKKNANFNNVSFAVIVFIFVPLFLLNPGLAFLLMILVGGFCFFILILLFNYNLSRFKKELKNMKESERIEEYKKLGLIDKNGNIIK